MSDWAGAPEQEIETLREMVERRDAENEALRGRVAEAEHLQKVYVLRKQAEAVEEAARACMPGPCGPIDDHSPEYQAACESVADVRDYAQRLRNQADELERNQ